MTTRAAMPDRRETMRQKVKIGQVKLYLDYIARHLLVHYCGREDLAHIPMQP